MKAALAATEVDPHGEHHHRGHGQHLAGVLGEGDPTAQNGYVNDHAVDGVEDDPEERYGDHEHSKNMVDTPRDRKSTRLNSSHVAISYAVFCLKKKKKKETSTNKSAK